MEFTKDNHHLVRGRKVRDRVAISHRQYSYLSLIIPGYRNESKDIEKNEISSEDLSFDFGEMVKL